MAIWLQASQTFGGPVVAHVYNVATYDLKQGQYPGEGGLGPAHHDGEGAVDGSRFAAGDGAPSSISAPRSRRRSRPWCMVVVGEMVLIHDQGSGAYPIAYAVSAQDDLLHIQDVRMPPSRRRHPPARQPQRGSSRRGYPPRRRAIRGSMAAWQRACTNSRPAPV